VNDENQNEPLRASNANLEEPMMSQKI
jgi:hypothetical protein